MNESMFLLPVRMQQLMLSGTMLAVQSMLAGWTHVLEEQSHLAHHIGAFRRAEDIHRHPRNRSKGPDLMDHYGRRSHDVDVERI